MESWEIVSDRYGELVDKLRESDTTTHLSDPDRTIWYVVTVRCKIDMSGFESLFNGTLNEEELLFLIAALDRLDEPELADAFRRAHAALRRVGYLDMPHRLWSEFDPELEAELAEIEDVIVTNERLWDLDEKLAALIA